MRQSFVDYMMRVKRMMARRRHDSASMTIVITMDGPSATTEVASHQVTEVHRLAAIIHLINSAHRDAPNAPEIKALKACCDREIGTSHGVADMTKGVN